MMSHDLSVTGATMRIHMTSPGTNHVNVVALVHVPCVIVGPNIVDIVRASNA
jgi:hypothetical protein